MANFKEFIKEFDKVFRSEAGEELSSFDIAYICGRITKEEWLNVKIGFLKIKLKLLDDCREEALALLDNANTIHSLV